MPPHLSQRDGTNEKRRRDGRSVLRGSRCLRRVDLAGGHLRRGMGVPISAPAATRSPSRPPPCGRSNRRSSSRTNAPSSIGYTRGVTVYTIVAGILAFADETHSVLGPLVRHGLVAPHRAGFLSLYALHLYLWRVEKIRTRIPGGWDDPGGPLILGSLLAGVMFINFVVKCKEIRLYYEMESHMSCDNEGVGESAKILSI